MSDPSSDSRPKKRVNVRRPDVMAQVEAEVSRHYESSLVKRIRENGNQLSIANTTIFLAQSFGFCYGVERAIDLAYAARRVFDSNRIFLIGEIIHNPEVNRQLDEMHIIRLPWMEMNEQYDDLTPNDVVIVPAFGAPIHFMDKIDRLGAQIVDTTCGDVMKVWRRVRDYAKSGVTSIIHGKAIHEETRATASRALGDNGDGHYLVILTLDDAQYVGDYMRHGGNKSEFLSRFPDATSPGFDPDLHLTRVGVANQTTMLKSETLTIQNMIREAVVDRDGSEENFRFFDTICGATQERQDALFELLKIKMDLLLVVGGYNSSNTTHLVEIGEQHLPSFFIRNSTCLKSLEEIVHYDLHHKEEIQSNYAELFSRDTPLVVGITAGASCPANLIEETVRRIFLLRGTSPEQIDQVL